MRGRSLWSRLHWIQKFALVGFLCSFLTVLSGIAIIQGLTLGWSLIGIGLVTVLVCIFIAYVADGLEEEKSRD